jgi:hypothetical protein
METIMTTSIISPGQPKAARWIRAALLLRRLLALSGALPQISRERLAA